MFWFDKRYHSLNYFLKTQFNEKIIKISLNSGLTCPNRDGTLSFDGCIFCSSKGSGDFTENNDLSIQEQFDLYRNKLVKKWPHAKYISYFQSYTNTYGNIEYLRKIFYEAINIKNVVAISIATRPDCLNDEILELLHELTKIKLVFVELGFQTSKNSTVRLINRCYENNIYDKAVFKLKEIGVNIVTHIILGLPYETKNDMLNTVQYITNLPLNGIKLQLLNVLRNTKLHEMFLDNKFDMLTFDEYIDILINCIEIIPKDIVIHRLTGDGPKSLLVSPNYSKNKRKILNTLDNRLNNLDTWQGKKQS